MEIKKNTKTSFDAYHLCYFLRVKNQDKKAKKADPSKIRLELILFIQRT